jgi:hypothetical protein
LKPLSNGCLGIIIKINLTTNYQLLLNCNKVHRAILVRPEGAGFLPIISHGLSCYGDDIQIS